jgi:zinc protease
MFAPPRRARAAASCLALLAAPLAALAPARPASAQGAARPAAPAPAAVPDIPYRTYVLKNGLTLLVHEDHKAPIVAVNVWYHVGSKNERAGKTGFAHLFEHLMFNGSENFNDDFFKAVEPIGATDLNGTTNEDRTNYFQNVPVSALDRILWLESDRMGHLLGAVDSARLNEQRGVVQNEKRQGENQPYGRVWITIAENTYPKGHPYSWSVIGSMEDLNAASLADVKDWFRDYYGAANATLVVAGDVNPDDVWQRVERYFGDIPAGPPVTKHEAWVAKMAGERRQTMQDRVPQARVHKVWNVPQTGTVDAAHLELVANLLADGKSSRLYKRLVYADQIATDVVAFVDQREIGSQLLVWATAKPGQDLARVEQVLNEELARLLADGPTPEELARVKTQYRANFVRGLERIGGFGGKSDVLAQGQVYLGDPAAYKTRLARVERASAADLQGAARRWLSDGAYVLTVHPYPEYQTVASSVNRKTMPPAGAPPAARFPAARRATLSNGLKVVFAEQRAVPVTRMSLVLDAGLAADRSARPGTASLTLKMLDEGTRTRKSLEISDALASLGAELTTGSGVDASNVNLSVLTDKLDPALDLFADVVLNPSFPAQELARLQQQTVAEIQQEKVSPFSMALRVFPALLYGREHAYGTPLTGSGTEASVRATTREELVRFHEAWFKPNHATLVVVGPTPLDALLPKLERAFRGWRPGEVPAKRIGAVAARTGAEVYVLDRPGALQTVVMAAQLIPPKANPDEFALQAFNESFGGSFGSRINMNLREDKHWSYGAGSFAFDARGQRPWIVYAPVQTDKTKESVQEMMKELTGAVGPRPLTAEEVSRAKDQQTRTLAGRWETGSAVAESLREIVTYGLPADYYERYAERVAAVTPAAVTGTTSRLLQPGRMVWVVVGDRAKIEPEIRGLNIGEVRLIDADGNPVGGAQRALVP